MKKRITIIAILIITVIFNSVAICAETFNINMEFYGEKDCVVAKGMLSKEILGDISMLVFEKSSYDAGNTGTLNAVYVSQFSPSGVLFEKKIPLDDDWMTKEYVVLLSALGSTVPLKYEFSKDNTHLPVINDFTVSYGSPLGVFTVGETAFQIKSDTKITVALRGTYTVTDYFGKVIDKGAAELKADNTNSGTIELPDLDVGYYTLDVNICGIVKSCGFSVVPESNNGNQAIGTDMALSFVSGIDYKSYIRAARLAGVRTVRERLMWNRVQTSTNEYNYSQYDNLFEEYRKNGIAVEACVSTVPVSMRTSSNGRLPNSLQATYEFWKNLSSHYAGTVVAYEFLNEPELSSGLYNDEPADVYTALLKAAAAGIRDSGSNAKVSVSGLAYSGLSNFAELALQNDMGSYIDIYNIHSHEQGNGGFNRYNAEKQALTIRQMEAYNIENRELWVSEAGVSIAPEDGENLSLDQQKEAARFVPVSILESISAGTDQHMWFIFRYLLEKARVYGSFTSDNKPMAPYSALVAVNSALADTQYAGTLKGLPDNCFGYVFENEEKGVVALYSSENTTVELNLGCDTAYCRNIMGNSKKIHSVNGIFTVDIGQDTVYIETDRKIPTLMVNRKSQTEKERAVVSKAKKVIMMPKFSEEAAKNAKRSGYHIDGSETVQLTVFNANNETANGTIKVKPYCGFTVSPAEVNVPLSAYETKTLTFTVSKGTAAQGTTAPLVFSGEFFGGESVLTTQLYTDAETINNSVTVQLASTTRTKWKKNNAGSGGASLGADTYETAFKYTFVNPNGWAQPSIAITEGTFADTDGLAFDIQLATPENLALTVMVEKSNGSRYWNEAANTVTKGDYTRVYIPWNSFVAYNIGSDDDMLPKPSEISRVYLGFTGFSGTECSYKIKNLGAYSSGISVYGSVSGIENSDGDIVYSLNNGEVPLREDLFRVKINGKLYEHSAGGFNLPPMSGLYKADLYTRDESGKASVYSDTLMFDISDIVLKDVSLYSGNKKTYTNFASDTMTINLNLLNKSSVSKKVTVFAIDREENGMLKDIAANSIEMPAGSEQNLTLADFPANMNEFIVLESDTLIPLTEKINVD